MKLAPALALAAILGCGGDGRLVHDGGPHDAALDARDAAADGPSQSCASATAPSCFRDFFSCFDAIGICTFDQSSMNMKVCWPSGAHSYSRLTGPDTTETTLYNSRNEVCVTGHGQIGTDRSTQSYTRAGVGELVLRAMATLYEVTCPDGSVHEIEYHDLACIGSSSLCTLGTCF